jgi:iron(III) transport system substrate-binding protein
MRRIKCLLAVAVALLWLVPCGAESAGLDEQWSKVLSAAKKEGRLAVSVHSGEPLRTGVSKFQEAYPDIRLEVSTDPTLKYLSRVRQERRAAVYNIDVRVGPPRTNHVLIPEGVYAPLRPALLLSEVVDDTKWLGGFAGGFTDREKKYAYAGAADLNGIIQVNRDLVPEAELNKVDDLLKPKWNGKIAMLDPRFPNSGNTAINILLQVRGEEFVRRLLLNQAVILSEDNRQVAEWLIRGRYPIASGLSSRALDQFQMQGLGLNVKQLRQPEVMHVSLSGAVVAMLDRPPNPNAAKVFVNWFLSRQGQLVFCKVNSTNSRRLDVPVVDPENQVTLEQYRTLFNKDFQENEAFADRALKLAKNILK